MSSVTAMLGYLQISVSGLASASIGAFDSHTILTVTLIMPVTSWTGWQGVAVSVPVRCGRKVLLRLLFVLICFKRKSVA
jgi:hypothetical protein